MRTRTLITLVSLLSVVAIPADADGAPSAGGTAPIDVRGTLATGTIAGTVTVAGPNAANPSPVFLGTCANLVATAKHLTLGTTKTAVGTGDVQSGKCSYSLPGVAVGNHALTLAFDGKGGLPQGTALASTTATVTTDTAPLRAIDVVWPTLPTYVVKGKIDLTGLPMQCSDFSVQVVHALRTFSAPASGSAPACTYHHNWIPAGPVTVKVVKLGTSWFGEKAATAGPPTAAIVDFQNPPSAKLRPRLRLATFPAEAPTLDCSLYQATAPGKAGDVLVASFTKWMNNECIATVDPIASDVAVKLDIKKGGQVVHSATLTVAPWKTLDHVVQPAP